MSLKDDQYREKMLKTQDRIESDAAKRVEEGLKEEHRMKDQLKNDVLDRMDDIVPRSEALDMVGRRSFSIPRLYK